VSRPSTTCTGEADRYGALAVVDGKRGWWVNMPKAINREGVYDRVFGERKKGERRVGFSLKRIL